MVCLLTRHARSNAIVCADGVTIFPSRAWAKQAPSRPQPRTCTPKSTRSCSAMTLFLRIIKLFVRDWPVSSRAVSRLSDSFACPADFTNLAIADKKINEISSLLDLSRLEKLLWSDFRFSSHARALVAYIAIHQARQHKLGNKIAECSSILLSVIRLTAFDVGSCTMQYLGN